MNISLKNNDLTEGKIWKVMLNFVLPIFLVTLFQSLYTTIDAIIIGRFAGKDAFAAIESVLSFQRLPVSFFCWTFIRSNNNYFTVFWSKEKRRSIKS